ncbi:MAG: YebC/PmpR family DNA-binding transcriptional regulator [Spirochaetes bacterium]|nr:MAG: YebC/PmpR family DNA-binding transcriptional regulator [Spirochaetota bacterium]
MSGHSKWASIKHKKGLMDARRGKLFTKLIREITVAARLGGGDPESNPRLRTVIAKAKEANMPKENIEKAIKKGTGELEGYSLEEVTYEGYGPGGVAIMIDAMTDNKNRTTAEIRSILTKSGGNLGENGCVSWIFEKKGVITISTEKYDENTVMEVALEAGAEDVRNEGDVWEVITAPEDFVNVKEAFLDRGIEIIMSDIMRLPKSTVKLEDEKSASKILSLIERLEDNDDVQNVAANFDIPDEIMEKVGHQVK